MISPKDKLQSNFEILTITEYCEYYPQEVKAIHFIEGDADFERLFEEVDEYFTLDCDFFRVDNRTYYFNTYFLNGKTYFVFDEIPHIGLTNTKNIFNDFVNDKLDKVRPKNWDSWYKVENGIAYRGGQGYGYELFSFPEK